jgi:hypothetical protein
LKRNWSLRRKKKTCEIKITEAEVGKVDASFQLFSSSVHLNFEHKFPGVSLIHLYMCYDLYLAMDEIGEMIVHVPVLK